MYNKQIESETKNFICKVKLKNISQTSFTLKITRMLELLIK